MLFFLKVTGPEEPSILSRGVMDHICILKDHVVGGLVGIAGTGKQCRVKTESRRSFDYLEISFFF